MAERETQMSLIDDTTEVLKYLELARDKKWLSDDAMHCRVTACNKLFSVLEDDERNADYVLQNLALMVKRYSEKNVNARPGTLKVYKSRLKSSLEDFLAWSQDPIGWEIAQQTRLSDPNAKSNNGSAPVMKRFHKLAKQKKVSKHFEVPEQKIGARKVSLPLRPNFDLEMWLPADGLTAKEIMRLGLYLYPYCKDFEENRVDPSKLI